jgi:hypothetical protein
VVRWAHLISYRSAIQQRQLLICSYTALDSCPHEHGGRSRRFIIASEIEPATAALHTYAHSILQRPIEHWRAFEYGFA